MTAWTSITAPDTEAIAASARRRDLLPAGSLGTIGPTLDRMAGITAGPSPRLAPDRVALVVFAGDHGIAYAGVSAYPPSATARRIGDLAAGVGPVASLASDAGVVVRTVDVAVRGDLTGSAVDVSHHVRAACGRIDMQDALSAEELERCFAAGVAMANAEVDGGADLLIGAVCGVGVSTPTAALVSAVTGIEPVDATTRGSGIDDAAWIAKCEAVRDARFRVRDAYGDASDLLRIAGGADLAALTGFIAQAAARRTAVLVDDVPSALCAVLANRLAPGTDAYVIAAETVPERTYSRLLQLLGVSALSSHQIGLGSGAGALLAVPMIRASARLVDRAEEFGPAERSEHAVDAWDAELL
jgi:nicotinate-nucleotide--dimethylbenzimidazole phosphoribosyltransferase